MSLGRTTPILRIFDEARAREFYVDFLGFKVDWEHRFEPGLPLYAQVSREGCVLHLSEHHGDASPGAAMRIESTDLDACGAGHEELQVCTPRDRADAVGHKRHVSQGSFWQSTHLHGWRFEHRRPHLKERKRRYRGPRSQKGRPTGTMRASLAEATADLRAIEKGARCAMRMLAVAVAVCAALAAQPAADLDQLFHARQWFELRSAVTDRSRALMRAAVATVFNDPETAERLLRNVIKSAPASNDADEAYGMLLQIYLRSGQYGRWVTTYRQEASRCRSMM